MSKPLTCLNTSLRKDKMNIFIKLLVQNDDVEILAIALFLEIILFAY